MKSKVGEFVDNKFDIAVPREYNLSEITTNPYPLTSATGMYWSWNSGYKFLVINGKSPLVNSNQNNGIHMSIGQGQRVMPFNFKSMMTAASLPKIKVEKGKTTTIYFDLDINFLLKNTDGSNYTFVISTATNAPDPAQVHSGYLMDVLKANASNMIEMVSFETK